MKKNYYLFAAVVLSSVYSCKKSSGGGNHQTGLTFNTTTLSGNGTQGLVNGGGTTVEFTFPFGVATDGQGNVYVADEGNNCIRKITPAGIVSTFAGSGVAGYADGTGAAAQFNAPDGVAVDAQGNVYVADVVNESIRKITSAGVVTTVAGMPQQEGYADGPGATAQFAQPIGIAVDGQGNIFVGDNANEIVRKITPAGVVSTLAGSQGNNGFADGTGGAAMFDNLMGVAVDGQGNVYVADVNNNRIRKIASGGVVSTLAGQTIFGHADGTGSAAMFEGPAGVATDAQGNIYVADAGGECIRKITAGGAVSTLAGDPLLAGFVDGAGSAAKFDNPTGVAIDGQGNIYVADNINNRIRKLTAQ